MRPTTKGFFVAERLIEAREARGLTQATVSKALGRSGSSTISNWERGEQAPEPNMLDALAAVLGVSVSYLTTPLPSHGASAIFFRSFATATAKVRTRERARVRWLQHISLSLQKFVAFPPLKIPVVERDFLGMSRGDIELVALDLRRQWGLGEGPIANMCLLCESLGAIVGVDETGSMKIDGQSSWSEVDARPYILLAADKNTYYRRQMDAAHELGHLVLHRGITEEQLFNNFDLIEDQAKHFAGAFLLPAKAFASEITSLSLDGFLAMKKRWRVSVGALIKRAQDIEVISDGYAQNLWKYRAARGWTSKEPFDLPNETPVEQPRLLARSIELLLKEHVRSPADLVERDIGIAARDIEMHTALKPGSLGYKVQLEEAVPTLLSAMRTEITTDPKIVQFRPRSSSKP